MKIRDWTCLLSVVAIMALGFVVTACSEGETAAATSGAVPIPRALPAQEWTLTIEYTLGDFGSQAYIHSTIRPFADLDACQLQIPELTASIVSDGGRNILALCLLKTPEPYYVE